MNRPLLHLALIIIIPSALLFSISWFVPSLLPQPWRNALFLLGVVVPAVLAALSAFNDGLQLLDRLFDRTPDPLLTNPLRPITLDELMQRFGRSAAINWIDRQITHPDLLYRHHRILITGRMKIGKSREAAELIRRAIAQEVVFENCLYEPAPEFRFLNVESLRQALDRSLHPHLSILLLLEDLPQSFADSDLDQLAAALAVLDQVKAAFIIATARLDQLTVAQKKWLERQHFLFLELPPLDELQTRYLVENATDLYELQLDDTARQAFIEGRDGTPELTLLNFRRLDTSGWTYIDLETAQRFVRESLAQTWANVRNDIQKHRPATRYLFAALDTFYAARIPSYTTLLLQYAAKLWSYERRWLIPWFANRRLSSDLAYLAQFDIISRSDQIIYPDVLTEGRLTPNHATEQIVAFLLHHRRIWRFLRLQRLHPSAIPHMWALFNLAFTIRNQGKIETAIRLYTTALMLNLHHGLYNNRGLAYEDQGKLDLALMDYNHAILLEPGDATAYSNRGKIYKIQGKLDQALADYTRAIEVNGEYAIAYNNRGNVYKDLGMLELALLDYNRALTLDPELAIAYNNRGLAYADQGKWELAQADHECAIALNPNDATAYYNRGNVHVKQGNLDKALVDYNRAIALDPKYAFAYYNRGNTYAKLGEVDRSITDYNCAIEVDPDFAAAYNNRGLSYAEQGRLAEALADYNHAIKLRPEVAATYANRGFIHAKLGKLDEALTDFNKAIGLDSEMVAAYYNRGNVYRDKGELELALVDYNYVVAIDPNEISAISSRGESYRLMKLYEAALADFEFVVGLEGSDWNYYQRGITYLTLAQTTKAMVDLSEAIRKAKEAYQANPHDWLNGFNLALYYLAANQTTEARRLYQIGLFEKPPLHLIQMAIDDLTDFIALFPDHSDARDMVTLLQ